MKGLFDTNILVYAYNTASPYYHLARDLFEEVDDIYITQQNLVELYAIVTDRKRIEFPISQKEATALIKFYQSSDFTLLHPTSQTLVHLLSLLDLVNIKNKEIFDTFLVATMLSHNIHTVFTHNVKDFQKFEGIEVINPFK